MFAMAKLMEMETRATEIPEACFKQLSYMKGEYSYPLQKVILLNGVKKVNNFAFHGCKKLESVNFGNILLFLTNFIYIP